MIYIECDDHHNSPIIRAYATEDAALDDITSDPEDRKDAHTNLFDPEEGFGEWEGMGDRFTIVDSTVMKDRATECLRLAALMEAGSDRLYGP